MKNKPIIAIYGQTGVGKSTIVNYLMRIPLEVTRGDLNKMVVKVDEDYEGEIKCKIGQCLVLSETLHSKGYSVIEEMIDEGEDCSVQICDNPGFGETRGDSFAVVTYLSMDKAIEVCKSINAIVVVVSFNEVSDRSSSQIFINLMRHMFELFPDLEDTASKTFSRFFILVTKCPKGTSKKKEDYISLFSKNVREFKKMQEGAAESKFAENIKIFEMLKEVCQERLDFVDIEERQEAITLLKKYGGTKACISKDEYKGCFNNTKEINKFVSEIDTAAYSWSELIFKSFYEALPESIKRSKKAIKK